MDFQTFWFLGLMVLANGGLSYAGLCLFVTYKYVCKSRHWELQMEVNEYKASKFQFLFSVVIVLNRWTSLWFGILNGIFYSNHALGPPVMILILHHVGSNFLIYFCGKDTRAVRSPTNWKKNVTKISMSFSNEQIVPIYKLTHNYDFSYDIHQV